MHIPIFILIAIVFNLIFIYQKLQKLSCGNTFSFRFGNSRNSDVHLEAGPVWSKQKAPEIVALSKKKNKSKPEIAAMKTRNFHTTVSRHGTYTHTHTNTHIQAGNSRNETAEFSHDSCRVAHISRK